MYIPIIAFSTHIWIQLSRFYNHKPLPGDLLEGQSVKLGETCKFRFHIFMGALDFMLFVTVSG